MTKRVVLSAGLVFALGVSGFAIQGAKKADDQKDIIKSTRWLRGKPVSFEVGDYVHAIVKDSKGQERSFFIGAPGVEYFLALHKGKSLVITYQVVDSYIQEAGGRQEIDRIKSAKYGKLDSAAWWKAQLKKHTWEELEKKYSPLIYKAN